MFSVGDLISSSGTGVCRVENIGPPPFDTKRKRDYYTLMPLHGSGTIYVPVDTDVFMRPIISGQEAEMLIERLPEIQQAQVDDRDYRALAQQYKEFLGTHCCEDLVRLMKAVYTKDQKKSQVGKKPSKVDQDFRKRAEMLLHDELSAALGISIDEVPDYIRQRLEQRTNPQTRVSESGLCG